MARPFKKELSYYPHMVNMWANDKFLDLRREMGLYGYGILTALLDEVYGNTYYLMFTDTYIKRFCTKYNCPPDDLKQVVNLLVGGRGEICQGSLVASDNFFDKILFCDHKILTSKSIQEYYLTGCSRKKFVDVDRSLWLLDIYQETDNEKQGRLDSRSRLNNINQRLLYSVVNEKKHYLFFVVKGLLTEQGAKTRGFVNNYMINVYNNSVNVTQNNINPQIEKEKEKEKEIEKEIEIEIEKEIETAQLKIANTINFFEDIFDNDQRGKIESSLALWNSLNLPKCRLLPESIPRVHEILDIIKLYEKQEILQAIKNYEIVFNSRDRYNPIPSFPTYASFMRGGIEPYCNDGNPLQAMLKSGQEPVATEIRENFKNLENWEF